MTARETARARASCGRTTWRSRERSSTATAGTTSTTRSPPSAPLAASCWRFAENCIRKRHLSRFVIHLRFRCPRNVSQTSFSSVGRYISSPRSPTYRVMPTACAIREEGLGQEASRCYGLGPRVRSPRGPSGIREAQVTVLGRSLQNDAHLAHRRQSSRKLWEADPAGGRLVALLCLKTSRPLTVTRDWFTIPPHNSTM